MTDFRKAIEIGLKNAEVVESANNEIQVVLSNLQSDVLDASKGAVTIAVEGSPSFHDFLDLLRSGKLAGSTLTVFLQSTGNEALKHELARYRPSKDGFPVTIFAFGSALAAGDAEGLRNAFATVLERPEVGRALRNLMSDPTSPQPGRP